MTVSELPAVQRSHPEGLVPGTEPRWQPSRAGILNVWRYYHEVFEFHHGRLLLRGPNGTGKSKALELLLPFLFDANLRANRLSTFGTGERTMHWNLMGEGATGTTRVGYVWLEFVFPGTPERWFTCGARLQASTHTSTVHADYFTTSQRIGTPPGLSLTNPAGQPLTRAALDEALGDEGDLYPNAGEYRATIQAALFGGMTEQRYDALITALLQLRTPKLSQRLDPALLSSLLSRALPPLGHTEISELAEGFERLDRQREQLTKLDAEVEAAGVLAARQQAYARRVLRAAAAALISATTDLDNRTRAARRSEEEHQKVAAQKVTEEERAEQLAREAERIEGQITGLTESEEYKQGRELDKLRQQVLQAHTAATTVRTDATRRRTEADTDAGAAQIASKTADARAGDTERIAVEARQAATRAGMTSVHAEITTSLGTPGANPRGLLRGAVRARHDQINAVHAALDDHERAVELRRHAEAELDQAREDLTEATQRQADLAEVYEAELIRLADRIRDWATTCRELAFKDPEAVAELAESETSVLAAVNTAATRVLGEITRDETLAESERQAARERHTELVTLVEHLRAEQNLPPQTPITRTADRETMTGAPLWRLVRFADTASEEVHGPVEAALQASGLLDAWVGTTGAIEGHDTFADPDAVPPAPGPSLADVLVPESDTEVAPATIARLLGAIAYGARTLPAHPAAISADGCWMLGNLTGSWHKDQPEYIGARARQQARERRIAELNTHIGELSALLEIIDARLATLRSRRVTVTAERDARPGHQSAHEAARQLAQAEAEASTADRIVRQRVGTLSAREAAVTGTLRTVTGLAAEHGVPAERTALRTLAGTVDGFREHAELWLDSHNRLLSDRRTADTLAAQALRSAGIAQEREQQAETAEARHRSLASTLDAVESSVGVSYRQVLDRLDALRHNLTGLRHEVSTTNRSINSLAIRLGELNVQRSTDATARDEALTARDRAARRFRHLCSGSFPADSGIDPSGTGARGTGARDGDASGPDKAGQFTTTLVSSEGVRATLDAARLVASTWPALPHAPKNVADALHRLSESVHACRDQLSDRADVELATDDDIGVFTAVIDGVRVGAAELLATLRAEAQRSREDITARERELFDQTLTGDTRRHLAARIRQAGELVDSMNARLERVRTASKVAVRLVWQVAPDLPPGTRTARDLLLKDPVRLTEADRSALHRFFRERIEAAKADNTATNWEQQLAHVFDYTAWHQFVVKVDRANGTGWQVLTRKLHGALSGGEKAIALHLPLFAAVAAHYQAVPAAPRVILLDEVFVGVDSTNRGQVFELLSALDLDLVLTSDHEWCLYRELDGIAIHQLITGDDGDDAVTTARFIWNGDDLLPDAEAS